MYELLYSPLVAGVSYGSVAFLNPVAGEFWYELKLVAEAAVPVALPLLGAAVGGCVTHAFTVSNPTGDELPLRVTNSNARNFKIELAGGGALLLPPYGEVEAVVTYTPSAIEAEQVATLTLQHPKVGEWVYTATGVGQEPDEMRSTEVAAPLGQVASGTVSFKNPFDEPLMLAVALEHPPDAPATPAFQLLLRKTSGLVVAPGGTLMLPFTFRTDDMTNHGASLVLYAAHAGRALCWRYPLHGVAVAQPLQRPVPLTCRARQPLQTTLELPIPGLDPAAVDEAFSYELDVPPEHAELLSRTLVLRPLSRTLSGTTLSLDVAWQPLRPLRSTVALVVQKHSGGRWRYELMLEATEPEPDDLIEMASSINKTAKVSFKLANSFDVDVPYTAYFSPESPSVFSVVPAAGVLPRQRSAEGELFTIAYTPLEYGKAYTGTLIVLTDEMQWSYAVRGTHPKYSAPRGEAQVETVLDATVSSRLGGSPTKNFLRSNMRAAQPPR